MILLTADPPPHQQSSSFFVDFNKEKGWKDPKSPTIAAWHKLIWTHYKTASITESIMQHTDEETAHQTFAAVWFSYNDLFSPPKRNTIPSVDT